jgi:hypothetical protein
MDSWLDRDGHPATRTELHYGARMIRCFVEREHGDPSSKRLRAR